MSHKINVGDSISFVGESQDKDNIKGNLSTERMCSVDWYDQTILDTTYDYTWTLLGTSDACALSAGGVCGLTLMTGTGDNEVSFLGTALIFDINQSPEIETKLNLVDVSGTVIYWGFSDANTETTPACTIDADSGTVTAVATNAVGFFCDADKGSSSLYCASVNAGGTPQTVDTGIDWTDGASHTLRVRLDTSGNAKFWVDGVQKGYIALATADVPLCEIINYGTRANDGSNVVYKRYLKKWQDIP